MLQPKKTKYRKAHKGRIKELQRQRQRLIMGHMV